MIKFYAPTEKRSTSRARGKIITKREMDFRQSRELTLEIMYYAGGNNKEGKCVHDSDSTGTLTIKIL